LLIDATDKQFAALCPRLAGRSDQISPILDAELKSPETAACHT
jgi:hypothetical protein